LAVWADAYKQFGINPVRDTPSISFLVKHIKSGKSIRSISPVVDLFNTFSLRYRIPCGGDDLDAIGGDDIRLGLANGDEKFSPIFKPEIVESPRPGEVVYFTRRTKRILCRRWNWRNADFSKITPATRNLAVNLDGMIPLISRSELEEATEQLADSLRYHCGGAVFTKILNSYETSFDVLSGFGVEVS
jgi:DNA/RNA-binding domain of Phe-tRNA-synthetase-like protein